MSTIAEEAFSGIRTVKAFSNEDVELSRFQVGNQMVSAAGKKKAGFQAIFTLLTSLLTYGAMAAALYLASILYKDNNISVGEIAAFMYYMLALNYNFMVTGMVFGNVASVVGASDKVVEILQYEPAIKTRGGAQIDGEINGKLEIRGAKFRYPSKTDV